MLRIYWRGFMVQESSFDDYDLDRIFLTASSFGADIFANTYGRLGYRLVSPLDEGKFDNAPIIQELATRALIVLGGLASIWLAGSYILLSAVVLGAGSKLLRAVGFYFQKDGFTHIRGKAPEKSLEDGQAKVLTWNMRGYGGGLHYTYGVTHWQSRIDRILEDITKEDPDILVLQDVHDIALVKEIIARLEGSYAHFFAYLGANPWKSDSGGLVIAKCAVDHFEHTSFEHTDTGVRGFDTFEIKINPEASHSCARIISTQLTPGRGHKELRMQQVAEIVDCLAVQPTRLPTLFVGSLGMNRDSQDEGSFLSQYLYHSYLGKEPTHSDALRSQWAPIFDGAEESSDFISFFKRTLSDGRTLPVLERGIRLLDSHLVPGYDENLNTKTARSDHSAVVTTCAGLRDC
ncbi:MAG: hypothetical protein A3D96_06045 [Chlamydiae bacterium RIFCSPHIGHO2_12_FULL_44_59]|nr:MAG: hypothetical protein A2796_03870 [Chlamydiae bacterium RIFCSPHIGHO2_01_FULL_44_39]OGN61185.1 MAG: hypothetical protein A3D96_06045 [Chlamydiae bacterium RIFCSPHIGHO2_12_FULL_44_59]OGN65655.1 MAG: hypothetical protein A2978_06850 [Chlamydiae bacterium RIFCSPLOWO2_01_FULL_44_52]OGN68132.1 MAG: hypothetical protein A3I67_05520 [Chlamydiae bacterium RIFCSPLOWO2_02_FULL_45_22]OGN69021.1 MAG: hypothetical protein A3F79_02140 [Chlamydiae bacterium RIFCSPLOWO2_12_FULL_45_20]